jgi:hypothetical protein
MTGMLKDYNWWPLLRNWDFFGDVFNNDFKDWWRQGIPLPKSNKLIDLRQPSIENFLPNVRFLLKRSLKTFDQNPEKHFSLKFLDHYPEYVFIGIPVDMNAEEIPKQINKIKSAWSKNDNVKTALMMKKKYSEPIGKLMLEDLAFYLKVHDLQKTGLIMKDIIKKLGPKYKGNQDSILRLYRLYARKAKIIITNVENGEFPGDYGPPDR